MATLEIRGALNCPSLPVRYAWKTEDGIEVQVEGQAVTVRWTGAPEKPDSWARMEAPIQRALYSETLATGRLAEVQWQTRVVVDDTGQRQIVLSFAREATAEPPLGRLDEIRVEPALDVSLELYFATWTFREGLRHLAKDNTWAAMQAFFVAAETVVVAIRGDSHEKDWVAAANELGLDPKRIRQLYLSLQLARHASASHARAKLQELRLEELSALHCRGFTRDILKAYARTSPRTVGTSQD